MVLVFASIVVSWVGDRSNQIVIMIARIVRRMMRSNLFGTIAGLLMAMEGLSLVLARTGHVSEASSWLTKYLSTNPEDPQRVDLEQLLEVLTD